MHGKALSSRARGSRISEASWRHTSLVAAPIILSVFSRVGNEGDQRNIRIQPFIVCVYALAHIAVIRRVSMSSFNFLCTCPLLLPLIHKKGNRYVAKGPYSRCRENNYLYLIFFRLLFYERPKIWRVAILGLRTLTTYLLSSNVNERFKSGLKILVALDSAALTYISTAN